MKCDNCSKHYHLRCAGLSQNAFIPTTSWFCYKCHEDIFPFNSIPVKQVFAMTFNSTDLNKHPNKLRTLNTSSHRHARIIPIAKYNKICNVCTNKVGQPNSAIPCPSCNHLIHKKCTKLTPNVISQLKQNLNVWECSTCTNDKFPFSETDDVDIYLDSFNSNWSCGCKTNTQPFVISPDSSKFKLILSHNADRNEHNMEFDENYDSYHSLKPDFKYYANQM